MVTDLIAEREYLEIYARRYRTEPGLARCYRSRDNLRSDGIYSLLLEVST